MTLVLDRDPVLTSTPSAPEVLGVRVRPLTRSDGAALEETFRGLSERSRFLRYHSGTPRLTERMSRALLDVDGRHHVARVAEVEEAGELRAIGIARAVGVGGRRAELAVEVVDAWHRRGIGTLLVSSVRSEALRLGYVDVYAEVLAENRAIRGLLSKVFAGAMVEEVAGTLHLGVGRTTTTS